MFRCHNRDMGPKFLPLCFLCDTLCASVVKIVVHSRSHPSCRGSTSQRSIIFTRLNKIAPTNAAKNPRT